MNAEVLMESALIANGDLMDTKNICHEIRMETCSENRILYNHQSAHQNSRLGEAVWVPS